VFNVNSSSGVEGDQYDAKCSEQSLKLFRAELDAKTTEGMGISPYDYATAFA